MRKLYDFGAGIIVAVILGIIAAGALGGGALLSKKLDTVKTLTAALTIYDGLITGADVYVTECAEHVIDQSCVPLAHQIFIEAEKTKGAYLEVKKYGTSPPETVSTALIAAVNTLQAYFVPAR